MTIDTKAIRAATQADMECPREEWEAAISEIQSATVIALLDRLEAAEAQLAIYEKHGVTCQTFGHKLTGCAECNRDDAMESVNETNAALANSYLELLPKLEAAEKDAVRYRWLKTGNDEKHSRAMKIAINSYGYEWDELIDTAMKEQK